MLLPTNHLAAVNGVLAAEASRSLSRLDVIVPSASLAPAPETETRMTVTFDPSRPPLPCHTARRDVVTLDPLLPCTYGCFVGRDFQPGFYAYATTTAEAVVEPVRRSEVTTTGNATADGFLPREHHFSENPPGMLLRTARTSTIKFRGLVERLPCIRRTWSLDELRPANRALSTSLMIAFHTSERPETSGNGLAVYSVETSGNGLSV
ncbi:hypothetical protein PMIN01_11498 [Paraphaeosphaeria minitans]|uniref:Uncharacterized protein n=1 Tax=Paraphaeosphaeria minitans TaxID=565426 RepID=A0A9P6KLL5_9PLEO|nr:hypothetical protein PMIN01_11498 [Paraphaeosphaeria minitans]